MAKKYIDKNGYERYDDTDMLVHRRRAFFIYKKNRSKYPLPFGDYVIHHKDGDKLNNDYNNLEILTQDEHFDRHSNDIHGSWHTELPF